MADEKKAGQTEEQETFVEDISDETVEVSGSSVSVWLIVSIVLLVLLIGTGIFAFKWRAEKKTAQQELVQKTRANEDLARQVSDLEGELSSLKGINQELDQSLESAYSNMEDKDILISRLNRENQTLKEISTQVAGLNSVRSEMASDIEGLNAAKQRLQDVYDRVNATIKQRTNENDQLKSKLNK